MVSLREIKIVETQRDLPGGGAHRSRRRALRQRNTYVAIGVLIALCCVLFVWNMQVIEFKRQGREQREKTPKQKLDESEEDSRSSEESSDSDSPDTTPRPTRHRPRRPVKVVIPDFPDLAVASDSSGETEDRAEDIQTHKHHRHHHHHHHHHHRKHEESSDEHQASSSSGQSSSNEDESDAVKDADSDVSDLHFGSLEERIAKTVSVKCDKFAHLKDKTDQHPRACHGPPIPSTHTDLLEATGCDLFTVPFNPAHDERCLKLLADSEHWDEMRPMTQKYDERTIKFKVTFKADKRLKAIVKVPQKLFQYEAMSEVGSFFADRVMQTNRVPPTAWAHVPVKRINSMLDRFAGDMKLIDIFAKESHVHTYREWVDKDFLKYNRDQGWMVHDDDEFPGEEVVGVSVQLFIADVRPLLSSDFLIPWVPHSDSWQTHMSPEDPWEPRDAIGMVRQSELAMYDFVIGNGDRSPNKNNFVVGGCRHHRTVSKCGDLRHPGAPSFVTLDNGMWT